MLFISQIDTEFEKGGSRFFESPQVKSIKFGNKEGDQQFRISTSVVKTTNHLNIVNTDENKSKENQHFTLNQVNLETDSKKLSKSIILNPCTTNRVLNPEEDIVSANSDLKLQQTNSRNRVDRVEKCRSKPSEDFLMNNNFINIQNSLEPEDRICPSINNEYEDDLAKNQLKTFNTANKLTIITREVNIDNLKKFLAIISDSSYFNYLKSYVSCNYILIEKYSRQIKHIQKLICIEAFSKIMTYQYELGNQNEIIK